MSELRQVVWKCDRCGEDAQAIFGIFPSCKCGSTSFKAAQHPAPTAQQCHCKDRPADQCPGEWEPGCDLGANPAHVQVAQPVQQPGAAHIGESNFEGWYSTYWPQDGSNKQRMRDSYAAGMRDSQAAPAQRQPLSEAQIWEIGNTTLGQQGGWNVTFARAIEAAHGITAATAAQKGEKL